MKFVPIYIFVMLQGLLLVISFIFSTQTEWVWMTYAENGFKVLVPVALNHKVTDIPTSTEIVKVHQYHGGAVNDSVVPLAFVIDYYLIPAADFESDDAYQTEFFENTIDELLSTLDGTLIYMDVIHQPGQDVCIWKGQYNDGAGAVRGNIILAGRKYYGLQVFGLETDRPDALMSKFLDSFKLI